MGLVVTVLTVLSWFFLSFMGCHYFLKQIWRNATEVLIVSIVYAILFAVFVKIAVG